VTNYEVDKTVRVTRNATGTVKRLNTAVVVNHRAITDAKGKTTYAALSSEELDKLTALVRESVGYDEKRGDSVKVINAPFKIEKVDSVPELPLWKQPETLDLLRVGAVPAATALLALLVVFGLVRPALKAASPQGARRGGRLDAVVGDAEALPAPSAPALPPPRSHERLDGARAIAQQNPAAVAAVVRNWVGSEAS
jgi:flagellar M-ring protein FliF